MTLTCFCLPILAVERAKNGCEEKLAYGDLCIGTEPASSIENPHVQGVVLKAAQPQLKSYLCSHAFLKTLPPHSLFCTYRVYATASGMVHTAQNNVLSIPTLTFKPEKILL